MLPKLSPINQKKTVMDTFCGHCHKESVPVGAFSDMENMTCDDYPILSTRQHRGIGTQKNISGLAADDDTVYWIANDILHIKKQEIALPQIKTNLYDSEKLIKGKYYVNGNLVNNAYIDTMPMFTVAPGDKIDTSGFCFTSAHSTVGGGVRIGFYNSSVWVKDLLTQDTYNKDYIEIPAGVNQVAVAFWADDVNRYYYNISADAEKSKSRHLFLMGANLFIFPDKIYVNTKSKKLTIEYMENVFEAKQGYTLRLFKVPFDFDFSVNIFHDANLYDPSNYATLTGSAASNSNKGDVFVSVAQTPSVLYQITGFKTHENGIKLSNPHKVITRIDNYYLLLMAFDENSNLVNFEQLIEGDYVEFKGLTDKQNVLNGWHEIKRIAKINYGTQGEKGCLLINAKIDNDSYCFNSENNQIEVKTFHTEGFAIQRSVPDMEYIVGHQNRLWGCNSEKNEIYCSALGDFKNWRKYEDTSVSSYAASVGIGGQFTGLCVHNGTVTFFKENAILKIQGTRPQNFAIYTYDQKGIEHGSGKSLCIIGGMCFYKAVDGVYTYDGNTVRKISDNLGNDVFHNAVAGKYKDKYYICMYSDKQKDYILYTYDTTKGLWAKEDNERISLFVSCKEELYYIRFGRLYAVSGKNQETEQNGITEQELKFTWSAETGDLYEDSLDKKYISKLQFRLSVAGELNISLQQDSDKWDVVYRIVEKNKKSITIPIIPKRCDYLRIRFEGAGDFKLYAIALTSEKGSELDG